MARPERHDCDYFPFFAKDGRTLHILERKYECKGTGFFTNVMRFLTLQEDHHFCIKDEADSMYFFSKCRCDEQSGMDMLNIMAKTRKIHTSLWVSYKVITSPDLLKSLSDAYRNRKNKIITIKEIESIYSDLEVSDVGNTQESEFPTEETHKEVSNQCNSYVENTQTKLKETKLKKKKIYKRKKFIPPSLDEVIQYFVENGYSEEAATSAFKYYHEGNWKDSTGKQVLNWKQKMRGVWFKPENKVEKLGDF